MTQCKFEGCEKKSHSRGYCMGHYRQISAGEPLRMLQVQHHGLSEYGRFMKWANVAGHKECWLWEGSRKKGWHGQWRNKSGEIELAHRAAWRLLKGEIPKGMFVLHRCDNPVCVNPSHLFLGSQSDNARDMWAKRRANPGTSIGEKHGMSKLTVETVKEIRASELSDQEMAAKLGISRTTVHDVRTRKTWKHVE